MAIRWDILVFALLTGSGMATFIGVALLEWSGDHRRTALIGAIASVVLSCGGLVLKCMQYGRPERIFLVLGHPSSVVAMEIISAFVFILLALVYIIIAIKKSSATARKYTVLLGGIIALLGIVASGMVYYLPARPAWHTAFVPLIYLLSSITIGMPFVAMLTAISGGEGCRKFYGIMGSVCGLLLLSLVGYLIMIAGSQFPDPTRAVSRFINGDLCLYFWAGILCLFVQFAVYIGGFIRKNDGINVVGMFICLVTGCAGTLFIRGAIYAMGTSIQQYIY